MSLTVTPVTRQARPGETASYLVTVLSKANINADVQLEALNVPPSMTATFATPRLASTQQSTQFNLETSANTPVGEYTLSLRGRVVANGQVAQTGVELPVAIVVIAGTSGFNLVCDLELTIPANSARTLSCRAIRDPGFTSTIDLSFAAFPEFVRVTPLTVSLVSPVSGFAFDVSRPAGPGTPASYNLTVIGRSGSLAHQATVRLVFPPAL